MWHFVTAATQKYYIMKCVHFEDKYVHSTCKLWLTSHCHAMKITPLSIMDCLLISYSSSLILLLSKHIFWYVRPPNRRVQYTIGWPIRQPAFTLPCLYHSLTFLFFSNFHLFQGLSCPWFLCFLNSRSPSFQCKVLLYT